MNVTINITELATLLAHNATVDEMIANGLIDKEEEVWLTDKREDNVYEPDAQTVFNRYYDYYYALIKSREVK